MPEIRIAVRDKIAAAEGLPEIVCGNGDYTLVFEFDAEWTPYRTKTARFFWYDIPSGTPRMTELLFDGSAVTAPVMRDTHAVAVGVYAGDLHTTSSAWIPCRQAITDMVPFPDDPPPELAAQLLSYLRDIAEETAVRNVRRCVRAVPGVICGCGSFTPLSESGGM